MPSYLLRIARSLRDKLRAQGVRLGEPRSAGACVEVLGEWRGRAFALYLYPGRFSEAIVAKLTPIPCGCEQALTCPQGLFVLGEEDVIADALYSKLDRLYAITRMVEEEGFGAH